MPRGAERLPLLTDIVVVRVVVAASRRELLVAAGVDV
jgi:hypothetical protein